MADTLAMHDSDGSMGDFEEEDYHTIEEKILAEMKASMRRHDWCLGIALAIIVSTALIVSASACNCF